MNSLQLPRAARPGITVLENYAELRTFAVPESSRSPGAAVMVLGRTSAGDGGAGFFHWMPNVERLCARLAGDDGTTIESSCTRQGMWTRVFSGPVDVRWFGASGNDPAGTTRTANSTDAFDAANRAANNAGLNLRVPAGGTYWLDNWVPLAGTTVKCWGATIRLFARESQEPHSVNPESDDDDAKASAAIVLRNNSITILGGIFEAPYKRPWTGCILVESGSDLTIRDAEIRYAWSGLFGHKLSDQSRGRASGLLVTGCRIHHCSHNIYLSDVDRLTIDACQSYNSSRDGIKTARDCSNIALTNCHVFDNGNDSGLAAPDQQQQSMDGLDLFAGGKRCVVTGNFLYRNYMKGIDIKRAPGTEDTVTDHDCMLIIANNHIFENRESGIEIEAAENKPLSYVENVTIVGNHIHSNQHWGACIEHCAHLSVANNTIYANYFDGLRIDKCPDGALINSNVVYGNGVWMGGPANERTKRSGIHILCRVGPILITGNHVYAGLKSSAKTQLFGIVCETPFAELTETNLVAGHRCDTSVNLAECQKQCLVTPDAEGAYNSTLFSPESSCEICSAWVSMEAPGVVSTSLTKFAPEEQEIPMCEMQSTELLEPNVPVYLKLVTSAAQRQIHAGENLRLRLAGFTAQGAFGIAFKYIRA